MDFNVINKAVAVSKTLFNGFDEQPVDCDFTLPDYYPDIAAVLKCTLKPVIQSRQISGDRISVDGMAIVQLLYLDEERKTVQSLEFTKPFSSIFTVQSGIESACITADAKTDYLNCRAISPRRIDVHGSFSVKINVSAEGGDDVVSAIECDTIQTRKAVVSTTVPALSASKMFSVSEVLDVGGDSAEIGAIVRRDASIILGDCKILANKAIVKGELAVSCLYTAKDGNGATSKVKQKIPFSQIVDADGLRDDWICDVSLNINSCEITDAANQNGDNCLLEVSAKIFADIRCFRTDIGEIITDAYGTKCEIETETRPIEIEHLREINHSTNQVREVFELPSDDVDEIVDIWCDIYKNEVFVENRNTHINAKLTTHMIARNFEGDLSYYERSSDITLGFEEDGNYTECSLDIVDVDFDKIASNQCEVLVELAVKRCSYQKTDLNAVVGISYNEDNVYVEEKAAIKIYYAESGESVWEVAKACHTSIEAVIEENALSGDVLAEDTMLLVPLC